MSFLIREQSIMSQRLSLLISLLLIGFATQSCDQNHEEFPLVTVDFHVTPRIMPDSSKIFIKGSNGFMTNPKNIWGTALEKQPDSSWRKSFRLPRGLIVRYEVSRGSWLKSAVDSAGALLLAEPFRVDSDTTIEIAVHDWKDNIVPEPMRSSDAFLADSYYDKGLIYQHTRGIPTDSTIYYYKKASELYERSGNWRGQLLSYRKLSILVSYQNDHEGIQYCKKALELGRKHIPEGNPDIALVYEEVGGYYMYQNNDYELALDHYQKALDIWIRELGPEYRGGCYAVIGSIYARQKKFEKALEYYQQSLACAVRVDGEPSQTVYHTYSAIAKIYIEMGQAKEAIAYLERCLEIQNLYFYEGHKNGSGKKYHLGRAYLLAGNLDKAEELMLESLQARYEYYAPYYDEFSPHVSDNLKSLAELEVQRKNYRVALHYIQSAIIELAEDFRSTNVLENPPIHDRAHLPNWGKLEDVDLFKFLELKASILYQLALINTNNISADESVGIPDLIEATLDTYSTALSQFDFIQTEQATQTAQLLIAEREKDVHQIAIETALEFYKVTGQERCKEIAFTFMEKSKGCVLRSILVDSYARQQSIKSDSLIALESHLRSQRTQYEMNIQKEKKRGNEYDLDKIRELEDQYFIVKLEHEALIDKLETEFPEYLALKSRRNTSTVEDLRQSLDQNSVLVEYYSAKDQLHIFTISSDDYQVTSIKKPDSLSDLCQQFASAIKRVLHEEEYIQVSQRLYRLLVKPIERYLANKDRLVLIPDKELLYLPFEALITDELLSEAPVDFTKLPYLIRKYEVSYHYSATLYSTDLAHRRTAVNSREFLGVAPVFGNAEQNGRILADNSDAFLDYLNDDGMALITRDGENFEELPFSYVEVDSIMAMFDYIGKGADAAFYDAASEAHFKSIAGKYNTIHVSTHGFANEEQPMLSGLAFSQPEFSSALEDGILYSGEIYTLGLNAELVVLSSCESGIGKLVPGEGMINLTHGFLSAGARNVVVSLWKVFDAHTSELMIKFYQHQFDGQGYASALRAAKLDLISNPNTAQPSSWSSFILIGQ